MLPPPPPDVAPVSALEIQKWYDGHAADYRAPETVSLEYVDIDEAALPAATAAPADDDTLRQRYVQEKAREDWLRTTIHPVQIIASGVMLDPYALTIGFARRFATYKRANLILHDINRLMQIINKPEMPVQIIFAGKAHPSDEPGKLLIQEVYRAVKKADFGGRLVFLEDYDLNLARYLVQGVDVWMNTPRIPNEASGTSGQKAALNGVINFSVLDGWWREGFNGSNGWAIGDDMVYEANEKQDEADANSLYDTLEKKIVPLYYEDRSADNLPYDWIAMMKESICSLSPRFNIRRMLKEYTERMYLDSGNIK
jgi:starch phosphorylase